MLGQSTASPCLSAGGGSRCGEISGTCLFAHLVAITVWRSSQWGYRFLPVCEYHCTWLAAWGLLLGNVSVCLDGRIRPSAVLPPVASRCGGVSVAVLVMYLGGIWSDRAIGKAACSLPFVDIIVHGRSRVAFCWGVRHYAWKAAYGLRMGGCTIMLGRSHTAFRCPASCGLTVWWSVCSRSCHASWRHMVGQGHR